MGYSRIRSLLREGQTVALEDKFIKMIPEKSRGSDLEKGDRYFAERNSGPRLLTVDYIVDQAYADSHGLQFSGWVSPVEIAYSFDFHECVGVEVLDTCPGAWDGAVGTTDPCEICGKVTGEH